jgi:hypothetical protein
MDAVPEEGIPPA